MNDLELANRIAQIGLVRICHETGAEFTGVQQQIIAALRRGHELTAPEGETLWLIEQTSTVDGKRRFWNGAGYGWDALKAARYPTKEAAEEVARNGFNSEVQTVHGHPEVCEHMFQCGTSSERPPSGEMVMVKPETLMEMRAALRFYADDNHQVWVTFEPEGRKRVLQRMKDEPGWVETGEDHRGHEEFVETGARAENALKLLTDEENDAIDRAMLSAAEANGRKT